MLGTLGQEGEVIWCNLIGEWGDKRTPAWGLHKRPNCINHLQEMSDKGLIVLVT